MKTTITLLTLFISFLTLGQAVPNGDFENWGVYSYSNPEGWQTANDQYDEYQLEMVTKVAGVSGYAVRLETVATEMGDPAIAYMANTDSDPLQGEGGQPYSQLAEGLAGSYRYNLPVLDTALILILFKKEGEIISTDLFKIRNATGVQNTWTTFDFDLSLTEVPDSVIIAIASSNGIDEIGVEVGSWLELDDLHFTGSGVTQALSNGNFEVWNDFENFSLDEWANMGNAISRTNDSYSGIYALKLQSEEDQGEYFPSGVTTGEIGEQTITGGQPYTLMQDKLTGYYKYSSSQPLDKAVIHVQLTAFGMGNVGASMTELPQVEEYTYFEVPFFAWETPDTLRVEISTSQWQQMFDTGESTLIIDKVALESAPLSVSDLKKTTWSAYPNPADQSIVLPVRDDMKGSVTVRVYSLTGECVMARTTAPNGRIQLELDSLASGVYTAQITNGQLTDMHRFVKR